MILDLGGEQVVILTAGTGNDWATPLRRPVTSVAPLEPRAPDTAMAVSTGWTVYLPGGDPITRHDRVEIRGRVYTVHGTPDDWAGTCVAVQAIAVDRNAVVTLHKPASVAWSDADEATVPTLGTSYASGLTARIQALVVRSHNDVEVAEEMLTTPRYMVTLDHDMEPTEGDEVEVTACDADPTLVGRFFRIDHVTRGVEGVDRDLWTVLVDVPPAA